MATSKLGGVKTMLSGVVGDTLYSIIKNGAGSYEQMVSKYAAERVNPNTKYQALYRMEVTLMFRALQSLSDIIQYSFQTIQSGAASLRYFVSVNSAYIQKDVRTNWQTPQGYFYPVKADAKNCMFPCLISLGTLTKPKCYSETDSGFPKYQPFHDFTLNKKSPRMIDFRKALVMTYSDSFTLLDFCSDYQQVNTGYLAAARFMLNPAFGDNTVITAANVSRMFVVVCREYAPSYYQGFEHGWAATFRASDGRIRVCQTCVNVLESGARIQQERTHHSILFSRKKGSKWLRSTGFMLPPVTDYAPGDPAYEFGISPSEVFAKWWPEYDGESYKELFG